MEKIYIGFIEHDDYGDINVFFDECMAILEVNQTGHANWSHKYFDKIFNENTNIDICKVDLYELSDLDTKLKLYYGF